MPGGVAAVPAPGFDGGPARKAGWRRWLPLVGVISFIAICSVAMLLILGFSNGVEGLVIGLIAAMLPVPVLVGAFLWLDRYEPEPNRYLVFCFAWGAAVATLVAIGVNSGTAILFDRLGLPEALVAVLVAPFIEETMKALGPILLLWRRRGEWSGITDGIVYCGLSALGFAMVENVLYLGGHGYAAGADQYGPATGIQNVFLIFIVRILFTGFAHPLFTAMTGVGLGLAARSNDRRVRWLAPIAGLLLSMILHGTFNLLPTLSVATGETMIMLYGYLGFMVPFFFATVGFAIALRGWEGRLSERVLPYYVQAGWFAPPEVASLSSLGRRHSARRWAKRVAGDAGMKAMRGFQFAATRLAILRDGMQRGLNRKPADAQRALEEEQRLLTEIVGHRAVFTGRDPRMPQAFWNGRDYQIAFPDGVTRTVNAPAEPVVPVPVRLAPQPAMAGAYGQPPPGYGGLRSGAPGYPPPVAGQPWAQAAPGYGVPGYGGSPYGAPGQYSTPPAPGYGPPGQLSAPPAPGYGAPGQYSAPPAPGYGPPASAVPGQPFAAPAPGHGSSPYGAPGQFSAPPAPGYGPPASAVPGQPFAPPAPGYGGSPYGAPGQFSAPPAPGYGPPASAAPGQFSAPPAPGHGGPTYSAPDQPPAQSYGGPSHGGPTYSAPDQPPAQGYGGPSHGAPAPGVSDWSGQTSSPGGPSPAPAGGSGAYGVPQGSYFGPLPPARPQPAADPAWGNPATFGGGGEAGGQSRPGDHSSWGDAPHSAGTSDSGSSSSDSGSGSSSSDSGSSSSSSSD